MNYDKLALAGVDVDDLWDRFMGDESFVLTFVRRFAEDKNFERLVSAFDKGDLEEAERISHTMKGLSGTLSLTELYPLFTEQNTLLRRSKFEDAKAMMPQMTECYRKAIDGMNSFLDEK